MGSLYQTSSRLMKLLDMLHRLIVAPRLYSLNGLNSSPDLYNRRWHFLFLV